MISATAEPPNINGPVLPRRTSLRFRMGMWIAVAAVFLVQLALIFWIGNPPPPARVDLPPAPQISLAGNGWDELLALQDPTLFILPHRENFSGDAWMKITPQRYLPTNWTEPTRPLQLQVSQLGSAFVVFMQTNTPPRYELALEFAGSDNTSDALLSDANISEPSALLVEGDLARLRLLTPLHLPAQTNSELLTNTVVQLLVNADGYPFSPVVWSGSGSTEADALALKYAKSVRFAPLQEAALGAVPINRMIAGRLVFEWQTVPPAGTNTSSASP